MPAICSEKVSNVDLYYNSYVSTYISRDVKERSGEINEMIKSYDNAGMIPYFYYYRDRDDNEIDYVMEYDGELHPIKIKKAARIDESMIRAFKQLDKASIPRGIGAVICNASALSALQSKCLIIPVSLL